MREFYIIRPFLAAEAISGEKREFRPGDTVSCDTSKVGSSSKPPSGIGE
jgi:hypothetical protein